MSASAVCFLVVILSFLLVAFILPWSYREKSRKEERKKRIKYIRYNMIQKQTLWIWFSEGIILWADKDGFIKWEKSDLPND